jgi:hypothetical protein
MKLAVLSSLILVALATPIENNVLVKLRGLERNTGRDLERNTGRDLERNTGRDLERNTGRALPASL